MYHPDDLKFEPISFRYTSIAKKYNVNPVSVLWLS